MTDNNQVEDQDVELQEDDEEILEMKHDPKNAEAQSVASIDQAGDATGSAPKRKGDNTKKDPMPKTKAGMIAGIVGKMQGMNKQSLQAMYNMDMKPKMAMDGTDPEAFDGDPIAEKQEVKVEMIV